MEVVAQSYHEFIILMKDLVMVQLFFVFMENQLGLFSTGRWFQS
jgi:hypothetical protein